MKSDLRWQRTQLSLEKALIKLLKNKSIDKIKIKELTDEAFISRQTFYLHAESINDLYCSCFDRILMEAEEMAGKAFQVEKKPFSAVVLGQCFETLYKHMEDLQTLMGVMKEDLAYSSVQIGLDRWSYAYAKQSVKNLDDQVELSFARYYHLGGFYRVIREWVINYSHLTPEEMTKIFMEITKDSYWVIRSQSSQPVKND